MYRLIVLSGILICPVLSAQAQDQTKPSKKSNYVMVEVKGKIETGIAAIGGETTGTIISAGPNITWELDLGDNKAWAELAEKLSGKTVIVKGELLVKAGVEIRQRTIVKVSELKAAE